MLLKQIARFTLLNQNNQTNIAATTSISIRLFSSADIGKPLPKPFDYKHKPYGLWARLTDSSIKRLTDNTLLISVDGNFGSGKTELAQKLSKEIKFHLGKQINFDDMLYKQPNNANLREIVNTLVQDNERFHISTLNEWHENPSYKRSMELQRNFYYCRWFQFRQAILHLMSTGEGVLLERSPYSDYVIGKFYE
jgi:NADH dehydrogenase (ubiquinone) 1 alpha subcomplex subunit 10